MTERLTVNRPFHVATKRSGTKQILSGSKPVTPAGRVPRISLDNLAPDIQEEILFLPMFLPKTVKGRGPIKEAEIRFIAKTLDWTNQRKMWKQLVVATCENFAVVAPSNGE